MVESLCSGRDRHREGPALRPGRRHCHQSGQLAGLRGPRRLDRDDRIFPNALADKAFGLKLTSDGVQARRPAPPAPPAPPARPPCAATGIRTPQTATPSSRLLGTHLRASCRLAGSDASWGPLWHRFVQLRLRSPRGGFHQAPANLARTPGHHRHHRIRSVDTHPLESKGRTIPLSNLAIAAMNSEAFRPSPPTPDAIAGTGRGEQRAKFWDAVYVTVGGEYP